MNAKQFNTALKTLAMPQVGFSRLVGADPRTGRRWALGEVAVPGSVAILLQLLLAKTISVSDIDVARTAANIRRPAVSLD
jgi:hypothetical protein